MKKPKISICISMLTSNDLEWLSLEGDKFFHGMPFSIELSDDLNSANVIVLEAYYSDKTASLIEKNLETKDVNRTIIVISHYLSTILKSSDLRKINFSRFQAFELDSAEVLPENFLAVTYKCYEKLNNANS